VNIPHDQIQNLVKYLRPVTFKKNEIIVEEGTIGHKMYIVESGEVHSIKSGVLLKKEGKGDLIAETSLYLDIPYKANLVAATEVRAYELLEDDFDKIRSLSPDLDKLVKELAVEENNYLDMLQQKDPHLSQKSEEWIARAEHEVHHASAVPTTEEVQHAADTHQSAPLSIWLGILLDGIPESFVIGAGFLLLLSKELLIGEPSFGNIIPYTLIAGLFLSNLPEAMSSSIGMKSIGMKTLKILILWLSLMIITALGAVFGYYFGAKIPEVMEIAVEGLAAGAMLTMIAQTMIPEAVHIGGHHVVGLSTLAGYLAAVAFKLFE
jgi:CRP-like cAMP-binding protein